MNKILMCVWVSLWVGCGSSRADVNESEKKTQRQGKDSQAEDQAKDMVIDPKSGLKFISIPAGTFNMGSNKGRFTEKPIHQVEVKSFLISETEVTVGQYRKCVEAGRCTEPKACNWSSSPSDKEDHPINCVDWGQARTFAVWVGGDLPTEAQWEYAARGGEKFTYAGSNDVDEVTWYKANASSTKAVKTKKANGYGLYDMSGNVWEWTLDKWHKNYRGAPNQAEQPWGNVSKCVQQCDNGSSWRAYRGGGWAGTDRFVRLAVRVGGLTKRRIICLGFRVRRTLP